jgi:hypothetical protein
MSTLSSGTETFVEAERERLAVLADMLIPRDGDIPSASEMDVHSLGVETVVALRPDLVDPVKTLLERIDGAMPANVADLMRDHPVEFPALSELLASAYFLDARVSERLGYRARKALKLGDLDAQDRDLEDLTAAVIGRGQSNFRSTPAA